MKSDENKNVTMKDIAQRVGVSVDAVSKALRDAKDISNKKKEEIKKVADEMGYIPNSFAQSLKSGTANTIAILFNDFYNPYFTISCHKAFHKIIEKGYKCQLMFYNSELLTIEDIRNIMVNNFCGIISFIEPTDEVVTFFKARKLPFTLIGIKSNNPNIDCVYTDDYSGGMQVAEYFINNNYNNALYISNSSSETSKRRMDGFINFCNSYNKNCFKLTYEEYSENKILDIITKENIDFVFCFSDAIAISLKNIIKKKRIQNSIKIVGFDNLSKYYPLLQNIDSVGSNMDEIIEFACNHIIKKINNETSYSDHINMMFPTHIYVKNKN